MTPAHNPLSKTPSSPCDTCSRHLATLHQKLDYLIELMRDESLRYPHHQSYLDTLLPNPPAHIRTKRKDA